MGGECTMKLEALAHRGYPKKYPENTLIGYEKAFELGFSHIELDVQLSKDNIPVIMHDATIDRTTNGQGRVKDYTLQELKNFKVEGNGRIPTLEEALLYAKDKLLVSVELKQFGNYYKGLEEATLHVIQKTDMLDRVYVNSFDHFSIIKMRTLSKEIELGIIQHGPTPVVIPFMQELNARYLSLRVEYLTDEFVSMCDHAGICLVVWPVDTEEQFMAANRYSNVLCTTNELATFKTLYEKYYESETSK